jgi:hypothetical protein
MQEKQKPFGSSEIFDTFTKIFLLYGLETAPLVEGWYAIERSTSKLSIRQFIVRSPFLRWRLVDDKITTFLRTFPIHHYLVNLSGY